MITLLSFAHDFEVGGIYYRISSSTNLTVDVTYQGPSHDYITNEYTGDVTIPKSVTYNGINYSVTSIDNWAFYGCSGLTSIAIPNSVTSIRWGAFIGCSGLTTITIPNSVTSIDRSVFSGCIGLTSVTIGNSVKSIGNSAFYGCSGLTSVTIPNSVKGIGASAFSGCSSLTSVTIGNSVTNIYENAFKGCSGLTSVTIPNSVTSIGSNAFYGTAWYDNQPDGLVYAGKVAYTYKGSMPKNTTIVLKDGTLGLADYAFAKCSGLTSITIPNSVTSIANNAFRGCSGLTSVTIPSSVTSIDMGAFSGCSGLTSITIPNSVTSIGNSAFYGCSGLTSITIPNSVTSIDDWAFSYCSSLTSITSYIKKTFDTGYNWGEVNKSIPLYVPFGTKEKYKKTDGWKDFKNIIEFGGNSIEPVVESQEVDMSAVPDQMDLNGMVVGDTYYALDAENGDGADSENGCVVINSITTNEAVSSIVGKEISDESVKDAFKGVIFMVPVGTGKVSVTGQTLGNSSLMVKVGSQAAHAFQLAERETVQIPYTVTEPTYVYIYAGNTGATAARRTTATSAAENSVKLYSYKYDFTETTGIESLTPVPFTKGEGSSNIYSIDGRKVSNSGLSKGIYIKNGKKIVVK